MERTRVLLFSEDEAGLEHLIRFLASQSGLSVTVILEKKEAFQAVKNGDVDVIVLVCCLAPPLYTGLDTAAEMLENGGGKIIMLAAMEEREAILNALTIGVLNVLHRSSYGDLPTAIREAHLDRSSIHPDAAMILRQELIRLRRKEWTDLLTHSEKELLRLLSHGNNRKEIAAKFNITLDTVKVHIQHILKKVGAKTSIEALKMAKWQHFFDDHEG